MILIETLVGFVLVAVWSTMLAPLLQYAFKLVEGERNSFADAFRICFIANGLPFVFSQLLPNLIGESWVLDTLGPIVGLAAFTYFIAKELGDVKRSFLIALLLEGLTVLFVLGLMALLVAFAIISS